MFKLYLTLFAFLLSMTQTIPENIIMKVTQKILIRTLNSSIHFMYL